MKVNLLSNIYYLFKAQKSRRRIINHIKKLMHNWCLIYVWFYQFSRNSFPYKHVQGQILCWTNNWSSMELHTWRLFGKHFHNREAQTSKRIRTYSLLFLLQKTCKKPDRLLYSSRLQCNNTRRSLDILPFLW